MTPDQPSTPTPSGDLNAPEGAADEQCATDHGDTALSYEDARDELLAVVQRLETGGVPLQESVALWERGEHLANVCQRWLDGARARLDAVTERDSH